MELKCAMKLVVIFFLALVNISFISETNSFILIPEEVPSILSVLFSNIPPVKKGTDSRIGVGFRLGPNADYQLQFEIGPQLNTQPLGQAANTTSTKKRQSEKEQGKLESYPDGEKWLEKWRNSESLKFKNNETETHSYKISDPTKGKSLIVNQLRTLYALSSNNSQDFVANNDQLNV